jgi:hypothetical protein
MIGYNADYLNTLGKNTMQELNTHHTTQVSGGVLDVVAAYYFGKYAGENNLDYSTTLVGTSLAAVAWNAAVSGPILVAAGIPVLAGAAMASSILAGIYTLAYNSALTSTM